MSGVVVARPRGPWAFAYAAEKLAARGALPGAYGYDLAAHALRLARGRGVAPGDLLAAALPASWMVNARATSPVFRRWLTAPLGDAWAELLALTAGGPDTWLAHDAAARDAAARCVAALAVDGHGVAAVSKALALLAPEAVPLMDDAALWFALEAVPCPATADAPTAGAACFVPMMDWFARAVLDAERALQALARAYAPAALDAAQVLDRLLWFESWGYRHSHAGTAAAARWWWVADGHREGIVPAPGPHPTRAATERVDLATLPADAWRDAARAALHAAEA